MGSRHGKGRMQMNPELQPRAAHGEVSGCEGSGVETLLQAFFKTCQPVMFSCIKRLVPEGSRPHNHSIYGKLCRDSVPVGLCLKNNNRCMCQTHSPDGSLL